MSKLSQVSYGNEEQELLTIHRKNPYSDIWECDNCTWTGDIHFMKIHPCKYNKKNNNKTNDI